MTLSATLRSCWACVAGVVYTNISRSLVSNLAKGGRQARQEAVQSVFASGSFELRLSKPGVLSIGIVDPLKKCLWGV